MIFEHTFLMERNGMETEIPMEILAEFMEDEYGRPYAELSVHAVDPEVDEQAVEYVRKNRVALAEEAFKVARERRDEQMIPD